MPPSKKNAMKKTYRHIIYSLVLLGICTQFGCKDFLDLTPLDQLTADNFYKTESDATNAILSVYSPMQDVEWTGKGWMITEVPSDNSAPGGTDPDFVPIDNFTLNADNPPVANFWAIHYRQVTLANVFISKANGMELDAELKNAFIGEARFLRALAYFDLVRVYGGVPLITDPPVYGEDLLFPRSPVKDVYSLIQEDFEFAASHLPEQWIGANKGRADRYAALAYLSKVHLTNRRYLEAKLTAQQIIQSGRYRLMEDYGENFYLETSDNNDESIFQVQFAGCGPFGTGNAMQAFFAPWGEGITKDRDGWGSHIPTGPILNNPGTTMLDAFEPGDLRRRHTIMTPKAHYPEINAADGGYTYPSQGASASLINIKKYVVGSGQNICFMSTPQNAHLIRYADVLLMYAEAQVFIDGGRTSESTATEAFNSVRVRAGLESKEEVNVEDIDHERRAELAFEGHRWFDLIRRGNAVEVMALHGKKMLPHNALFPIPAAELEVNPKLEQNPGY